MSAFQLLVLALLALILASVSPLARRALLCVLAIACVSALALWYAVDPSSGQIGIAIALAALVVWAGRWRARRAIARTTAAHADSIASAERACATHAAACDVCQYNRAEPRDKYSEYLDCADEEKLSMAEVDARCAADQALALARQTAWTLPRSVLGLVALFLGMQALSHTVSGRHLLFRLDLTGMCKADMGWHTPMGPVVSCMRHVMTIPWDDLWNFDTDHMTPAQNGAYGAARRAHLRRIPNDERGAYVARVRAALEHAVDGPTHAVLERALQEVSPPTTATNGRVDAADDGALRWEVLDRDELRDVTTMLERHSCPSGNECTIEGYQITQTDIDEDGHREYLVIPPGSCGSGGCSIALIANRLGRWVVLADIFGDIDIAPTSTNGMRDILLSSADYSGTKTWRGQRYIWDGQRYRQTEGTLTWDGHQFR